MTGCDTCDAMNGLREIIPGDDTLIGEMVDAWHNALVDGSEDSHSQVTGVGRCAYLVEDHTQLRFLLAQADHGLHEVIAKGGIQPCRANDHGLLTELLNTQFTCQLRRAIDTVGTRGVGLHIRRMLSAVEDIVCRYLDDPAATFLDSGCQIGRRHRVQRRAEFLIVLRLIHCSIGGTVYDTVYFIVCHELFHGLLISDIQFCHIRIKIGMLGIVLLQQLHLVSQLPVATCNQYFHSTLLLNTDYNSNPSFLSL